MEGASRLRKHSARFALATAAVLLLSVSGVTEGPKRAAKSRPLFRLARRTPRRGDDATGR